MRDPPAALPLAHVRWFTPDPNRGLEWSAVFSGVTLLALAAIAATLGGAWLAQRTVTRFRLAARARVVAGPLLERVQLGLPRPADMYPWIAAVLAVHTVLLGCVVVTEIGTAQGAYCGAITNISSSSRYR